MKFEDRNLSAANSSVCANTSQTSITNYTISINTNYYTL